MKLAIFTPGAYVWPVHRSFEGFIISLGTRCDSADTIRLSQLYPVTASARQAHLSVTDELSLRLQKLHRDIYDALLRPSETYSNAIESLENTFWPDLAGTPPAQLLQALMYFFLRCGSSGVTVGRGLAVFRALFFNHESAEPEHWLHSALRRTAAERGNLDYEQVAFEAPAAARISDLAFSMMTHKLAAPSGTGMITGRISRSGSRLTVHADVLKSHPESLPDVSVLARDVQSRICEVFGWPSEVAA